MTSLNIKGTYRVYRNGVLVAIEPNLITTKGRSIILRYLAGNLSAWAGGIGVGSGSTVATVGDTKLEFEFERLHVDVRAADVNNSNIIIKASMPQNAAGTVHELGLYPFAQPGGTDAAGHLILDFNSNFTELTGGTTSTNSRVGGASYTASAAASATTTIVAPYVRSDFSGYGDQDTFTLAMFVNDANASTVRVRMKVDDTNYFDYTQTIGAATGYRTFEWQKSQFVATGTPSWDSIASAEFAFTAGALASTVDLDGFRINDTDVYPDFGLVSRAILTTPITKNAGESMDVEYSIGFTI